MPILTAQTGGDHKTEMLAWAFAEARYVNADQIMRLNPNG
jgi:hypothetical protein